MFFVLEFEVVGVLSLAKTELGIQILSQGGNFLHSSKNGGIDIFLVGFSAIRDLRLLLLALSEELISLFGGSGSLEVGIVELSINSDIGKVNNGGGGDDIGRVHAAERNSVDLEGSYQHIREDQRD